MIDRPVKSTLYVTPLIRRVHTAHRLELKRVSGAGRARRRRSFRIANHLHRRSLAKIWRAETESLVSLPSLNASPEGTLAAQTLQYQTTPHLSAFRRQPAENLKMASLNQQQHKTKYIKMTIFGFCNCWSCVLVRATSIVSQKALSHPYLLGSFCAASFVSRKCCSVCTWASSENIEESLFTPNHLLACVLERSESWRLARIAKHIPPLPLQAHILVGALRREHHRGAIIAKVFVARCSAWP